MEETQNSELKMIILRELARANEEAIAYKITGSNNMMSRFMGEAIAFQYVLDIIDAGVKSEEVKDGVKCTSCNKIFFRKGWLAKHMIHVHKARQMQPLLEDVVVSK